VSAATSSDSQFLVASFGLHILDMFLVVVSLHGFSERSLGEAFPAHLPVASRLEVMRLAHWTQLHSLPSRVMALLTKRNTTLQADIPLLRQRPSFMRMMRHRSFHRRTMPKAERIRLQENVPIALPLFRVPSDLHEACYLPRNESVLACQGFRCEFFKILRLRPPSLQQFQPDACSLE
jgi:hypothetical protein